MVEPMPLPWCSPAVLLPLLLSSWLFFSTLLLGADAEDGGDDGAAAALCSNSTTAALGPISAAALMHDPQVYASLALALSQDLNPNPFINPRPTLSLSLSLSVSEDIKGSPFGFLTLPKPQPEQEPPQQSQKQHQLPQEREQLSEVAPLQEFDGQAKGGAVGRAQCTYTVSIKTSCASPRVTRDAVSLTFGDIYRNEVYAARLDDPASGTFERCSVDTFRITGPCGGRTCYLYLRRTGRDGWTPEYVKVLYRPGASVTFFYGTALPNGVWYGFNLCHDGAAVTPLPAASTIPVPIPAVGGMEPDDDKSNDGAGASRPQ